MSCHPHGSLLQVCTINRMASIELGDELELDGLIETLETQRQARNSAGSGSLLTSLPSLSLLSSTLESDVTMLLSALRAEETTSRRTGVFVPCPSTTLSSDSSSSPPSSSSLTDTHASIRVISSHMHAPTPSPPQTEMALSPVNDVITHSDEQLTTSSTCSISTSLTLTECLDALDLSEIQPFSSSDPRSHAATRDDSDEDKDMPFTSLESDLLMLIRVLRASHHSSDVAIKIDDCGVDGDVSSKSQSHPHLTSSCPLSTDMIGSNSI
jgi:hypothetical protein